MTRRRAFDWVLIVALTASWAVLFARGIGDGVRTQRGQLRVGVSSAAASAGYPTVIWSAWAPALVRGDELVEVDGQRLVGSSALRFYDRATRAARADGSVRVVARRDDDSRLQVDLMLTPSRFWWTAYLLSSALLTIGLALLLRAPCWHLARRTFVASWCFAIGYAAFESHAGPGGAAIEPTIAYAAYSLGATLTIWNLQDFSLSAPRVAKPLRLLALVGGALFTVNYLVRYLMPYTPVAGIVVVAAPNAWLAGAGLLSVTLTYRRSLALERRQIRWIVLGFYVGLLASVFGNLASLGIFSGLGLRPPDVAARMLMSFGVLGIPAGFLLAVVGDRWLDIDRLISATAAYTIAGIAVLGATLAVVPRAAAVAAPALDVDAGAAQWLLDMALVGAAAFAAHRYLRPQLDRQMFAERHRRVSGLERLHDELAGCSGATELWALVSERLDALLEPRSLVVFAREGDGFVPRFARGREASQLYDADSVLVRALERRGRPLAADSSELDPFDRATLETLGVALVVPIATREALLAFACLGAKRSGDIYTHEEGAQLAAIAARCAEILRPPASPAPAQIFRHEGELWAIESRGKRILLRDMRGLNYLAVLLREPGREFAALDLVRSANRPAPTQGIVPDAELCISRRLGDAGPVLDAQARSEYRARVAELEAEFADAERCADLGRLERATEEREALLAELAATNRSARPGSDSDRARVAVTKAIKLALEKIGEAHPELGAHLVATVRRGYVCAYEPDPRSASHWDV